MCQHHVPILKLDAKRRVRKRLRNDALYFDAFFFLLFSQTQNLLDVFSQADILAEATGGNKRLSDRSVAATAPC